MAVAAGLVELDAAGAAGSGAGPAVSAWHGALAYHFWLLAHRQLYAGNTDAAMRTALHLRKYCPVPIQLSLQLCVVVMFASQGGVCPCHDCLCIRLSACNSHDDCSPEKSARSCGNRWCTSVHCMFHILVGLHSCDMLPIECSIPAAFLGHSE